MSSIEDQAERAGFVINVSREAIDLYSRVQDARNKVEPVFHRVVQTSRITERALHIAEVGINRHDVDDIVDEGIEALRRKGRRAAGNIFGRMLRGE